MQLEDLPWLPRPTQSARDLRRAIAGLPAKDRLGALYDAGVYAWDEAQLAQLARTAASLAEGDEVPAVTLGLLGDGTLSLVGPAVAGTALRYRMLVTTVTGEYGSAVQDAMNPAGPFRNLDFVLVCPDYRAMGLDAPSLDMADAEARVGRALKRLQRIVDAVAPSTRFPPLVQTLAPPAGAYFGSFDGQFPGSPLELVERINREIRAMATAGRVLVVDIARLAETVGTSRWYADADWFASKMPFAPHLVPLHADHVCRVMAAAYGKSRKCLVLDLDNTVWGGVIGDDGLSGIEIGQGSRRGEAHLALQHCALSLKQRGIVLAVSSKNDDAVARQPLLEHPAMALRMEDIAVFQANWSDKAANIRAIAKTLNIGLDALVFLDDNPYEREQVRRELPEVIILELPEDPSEFAAHVACCGFFEGIGFSDEDRRRAEFYRANAARQAERVEAGDTGEYLRSLDMVCRIEPVSETSLKRATQLINKTNQFNLRTRRYSEPEVSGFAASSDHDCLVVSLSDKFGDNGIIAVVVLRQRQAELFIDTWLMSCRVLGRNVEEAVLGAIAAQARRRGVTRIVGEFIPSGRNEMVRDLFKRLGFMKADGREGEATRWELDPSSLAPADLPMRVHMQIDREA